MKTFEKELKTCDTSGVTKRYFDQQSHNWDELYDEAKQSISSIDLKGRLNITNNFVQELELTKLDTSLDLGCGTGEAAEILVHTDQSAVDFSANMIEKVKNKHPNIKAFVADAESLPFENSNFNLVVALGLFEYIPSPNYALQEVNRVLKEDGFLIVSIPNKASLFRKFRSVENIITRPLKSLFSVNSSTSDIEKPFHQQWSQEDFTRILNTNEFQIESVQHCSYGLLSPKLSSSRFNIHLSKWFCDHIKPHSWLEKQLAHTMVFSLKKSTKQPVKKNTKKENMIKEAIKLNPNLHLKFMYIKVMLFKLSCVWISDKRYIQRSYKLVYNREPNLINPQTFNEKLQWLKLNHRDDLMRICADKYEVREYVKGILGPEVLNELIGVYEHIDEIDFDGLPEQFAMKVTHGSGQNLIVKNKLLVNWEYESKLLHFYMHSNHYFEGREWVYKNIKERIVCEEYLDENGKSPVDYKFFCFNGEPKFIQFDLDRFDCQRRNFYDLDWLLLPFTVIEENEYAIPNSDKPIEKPSGLDDMINAARLLARDFPFVRVDFYYVNNRIIFGELTFTPGQGLHQFSDPRAELEIGRMLKLPCD